MHQALLNRVRKTVLGETGTARHEALRFIRSCSAALPASKMIEMEDRFGVPVLEAYGMTEAAHQMASNPLPPAKRFPGSVGFGTGVKIAIMDDGGELLGPELRGEVLIQGPNVIRGYEDNPKANEDSFANGWFRTGDEGILDNGGCLTLVGRIKELINRSGEKISPVEIDEVLLSHPSVSEAVAFGVPHPTHGEEPSAVVVLSAPVSGRELVDHCRAHLAQYKCPRVIHIADAIPRTATGKVQRRIVAATIVGDSAG
jgi:acyl-CoA synthetase (AMP-forming)/AMP-acid ligase II